jgi:hypothetical protein
MHAWLARRVEARGALCDVCLNGSALLLQRLKLRPHGLHGVCDTVGELLLVCVEIRAADNEARLGAPRSMLMIWGR